VTNAGPSDAASLSVTDSLPAGVSFVSATAGGTLNGGNVEWADLGTLAAGAVTNLTLTVTAPDEGGSLTNVASVGSPTSDPNPTNNVTPPVTTTVTAQADVATTVSGPATVLAGASYDYTVTVTNNGPSTAVNVTVSNTLPGTVTFVSATGGGTVSGGVVSFPVIGSLGAGGHGELHHHGDRARQRSLTNTAASTADTADPVGTNNDGTALNAIVVTAVTPQSDVAVLKSGPSGAIAASSFTYTITVTNAGPSTATNVVASDVLPGNVSFVSASAGGTLSAGTVTWPAIASLANGGATSFTLTVKAPASGSITNTASVSVGTPDPNLANNTSGSVVTTVGAVADVAVINDGPTNAFTDTNFTYTITVTNGGPSTAASVVVTDLLPTNLTFVSASNGGTTNAGVVTWPTIAQSDQRGDRHLHTDGDRVMPRFLHQQRLRVFHHGRSGSWKQQRLRHHRGD